ncbi:transmembrane protein 230 [Galendromus occidentalis]|uniref:Transmembrane protein 230 n=1 Tax=Galendromus occidentalis TaxID=34638 RepID=A0AAJ6QSV3_9ACAR|nr:transmembrane protein 230 [Galendromus occidentalis]
MGRKDAKEFFDIIKTSAASKAFSPEKTYRRLRNDDFVPEQFDMPKHTKVPYKSIFSAVLLFIGGSILLSVAISINLSLLPAAFHESMWGLYTLGGLLFIPGCFYTYIAYQAYYGVPGFSYSDIPNVE